MRPTAYTKRKRVNPETPSEPPCEEEEEPYGEAPMGEEDEFGQLSEAEEGGEAEGEAEGELDRMYNDLVSDVPAARLGGPMDGGGFDGDNDEDSLGIEDEGPLFEQVGLPTRTYEDQELGKADPRSVCFGCVYVGEREQTAIPYRDVMDIIELGRASMGCSDQVSTAKEMARRYKQVRRKCNASLRPGERPLPQWKAATILEHLRCHIQDPEVQQWCQLRDVQELRQLSLKSMVIKNKRTGEVRFDEKQFKVFNDLTRLEWFLYKQDPQKARFYSGGAHIDPKTVSQGLICTSGKPVVDLWQGARKRRKK